MRIVKPDPFIAQYVYEKQTHPEKTLVWRQFKEEDVQAIDKIVELSHGERTEIKSQKDWEIFTELLGFYQKRWPEEFIQFIETIKEIRSSRKRSAYSDSKEILYVGSIPLRFMKIIKAIFPDQQFNKKFIWNMVRRFPIFKVTKEGN